MEFIDWTWNYIIVFLIVLSVLIFVHEWGHYWVARRNGVRVEVFSIGFGPEVTGWTNEAGTRWKIGLIPLGGYVKMFGEDDSREDDQGKLAELTDEERAVSFHHKTLGQRAAIVAAGPIVNFLFAIVAFAGLAIFHGNPVPLSVVGEIVPGSAAAQAEFQSGDVIVAIDNREVETFEDLKVVIANPERQLFDVNERAASYRYARRHWAVTANRVSVSRRTPHLNHCRWPYKLFTAIWVGTGVLCHPADTCLRRSDPAA